MEEEEEEAALLDYYSNIYKVVLHREDEIRITQRHKTQRNQQRNHKKMIFIGVFRTSISCKCVCLLLSS